MRFKILFIALFVILCQWSLAQSNDVYKKYDIYRNPFRVFINKISWSISTGYAATNYKHNLTGFYFFQDADNQQILSKNNELGPSFSGYTHWMGYPQNGPSTLLNDTYDVPYDYLPQPVNNPLLGNQQLLIDADTVGLSFSSIAHTLPALVSAHVDIKKLRLGFGYQFEQHWLTPLNPNVMENQIRPYGPDFKKTTYHKLFGILGYEFHEFWDYTFVAEIQLGRAKPGKQINTSAVGIGQNFFANFGVIIERNLSEYARITVRPSYDLKRFVINLPDASSIKHTNNAFMVQVGLSINIPEIPRSPMKSDHTQLKHVLTDPNTGQLFEVRGQSIWKEQNPKIGQNHRRLWRYKRKNKNKIDPY